MVSKCRNCPLRSRDIFESMTDKEVRYMQGFKTGIDT